MARPSCKKSNHLKPFDELSDPSARGQSYSAFENGKRYVPPDHLTEDERARAMSLLTDYLHSRMSIENTQGLTKRTKSRWQSRPTRSKRKEHINRD